MSSLRITTSTNGGSAQRRRARLLAERLAAPYVDRRSLPSSEHEGLLYVVGRARDELRGGGAVLSVHQGLLKSRLHTGRDHPMIRALAPTGQANRVLDGTLGQAGDALHVAAALGCAVEGWEHSPALFSLLEEGLPRLAKEPAPCGPAAARVQAHQGDSGHAFASLPADYADAVLLAPMYNRPDKAAPGFDLLRAVADHAALQPDTVTAALVVAPRVVVKWPRGARTPDALDGFRPTLVEGHRVAYWTVERS